MSDAALQAARAALGGRPAWLVGGAVRDRVLGRSTPVVDLDVVVEDDPAGVARAVAAAARAACFSLNEDFGAWRVVARDRSWQLDVQALRGGSLDADLALRDFTINAIAEPLAGGETIDPEGGLADAAARRLRMVSAGAFADDPLRVLRLARVAAELGLEPDPETLRAAAAHAEGLAGCAGERVFAELQRILAAPDALRGLELADEVGATAVVLPELAALRGVEQSQYHHADVYGHTLEVLQQTIVLTDSLSGMEPASDGAPDALAAVAEDTRPLAAALLAEPLADGLTRAQALRWGALLHDIAKPPTRHERPGDHRVTFIGHDTLGAELAREILARLRTSERLRAHVAALVSHHLRLGFLVHEPQPLQRRTLYGYLRACAPVGADVTLLSVADRLATRGERSRESIEAHLRLARGVLAEALRWHRDGPPQPLVRGDELARELGVPSGPRLGGLLEELAEARFAGEVQTREQALAHARRMLERDAGG